MSSDIGQVHPEATEFPCGNNRLPRRLHPPDGEHQHGRSGLQIEPSRVPSSDVSISRGLFLFTVTSSLFSLESIKSNARPQNTLTGGKNTPSGKENTPDGGQSGQSQVPKASPNSNPADTAHHLPANATSSPSIIWPKCSRPSVLWSTERLYGFLALPVPMLLRGHMGDHRNGEEEHVGT